MSMWIMRRRGGVASIGLIAWPLQYSVYFQPRQAKVVSQFDVRDWWKADLKRLTFSQLCVPHATTSSLVGQCEYSRTPSESH